MFSICRNETAAVTDAVSLVLRGLLFLYSSLINSSVLQAWRQMDGVTKYLNNFKLFKVQHATSGLKQYVYCELSAIIHLYLKS